MWKTFPSWSRSKAVGAKRVAITRVGCLALLLGFSVTVGGPFDYDHSVARAQSRAADSTQTSQSAPRSRSALWNGELVLGGAYGRLRDRVPSIEGTDRTGLADLSGSIAAQLWCGVYRKHTGGLFMLDWNESAGIVEDESRAQVVHSGRSVLIHGAIGRKFVLKKARNWIYIEPMLGYSILANSMTSEDTTSGNGQLRDTRWEHGATMGLRQNFALGESSSIFFQLTRAFYGEGPSDYVLADFRFSFPGDTWEDPGRIFVFIGFKGMWRDGGRELTMLHLGFGGFSMY